MSKTTGEKPTATGSKAESKNPRRKAQRRRSVLNEMLKMPAAARGAKGSVKARAGKKRTASPVVAPLTDAQLGDVQGVPTETQIREAAGPLSPGDGRAFARIRKLLAQRLGSHAAARLWLTTPSPGYESTPLEAVRKGQAKLVLAGLESEWGASPIYA